MKGRILILVVCIFALSINAQEVSTESPSKDSSRQPSDDLLKYLTAAEASQRSGNLADAAIENRMVLGIALQRSGIIAIEEGKYANASKYLTASLKYADSAAARTNLAIAYMRQRLFEKALSEARIAVGINAKHIGAHYILGNIYYTKEDYKAALPELEMVFSEAPDFEIGRALGFTYLNLKQPELARRHFEKMVALVGKESAGLRILFARFYERTNYPSDAERELRRALAIEPNRPKINTYLGYLLMQHGGSERQGEAAAAFERELKIKPDDFYALFFAGVVASSQNDHQKAIPFLKKAVEVNPNSGEAHLFLAQSQLDVEDLANAEKNLRRAVELEKNGGKNTQARRTHFLLGRLLIRTGKREEGRKELAIAGQLQKEALSSSRSEINRILGQVAKDSELKSVEGQNVEPNVQIKLKPERAAQLIKIKAFLVDVIAQAFNNLGVIETQKNQLSDAIENFSAAYEWEPDFPNVSRNLAIVMYRAGRYDKAIIPLSRHLETNPQDLLIRKMLGSSYYFTDDHEQSVETLKPVEAELFDDAELSYSYGISLVRLDRNQEAFSVFDQLAKYSQQNPEALFYSAQGFMIGGDYKRAVTEFGRVVSLAPETPKANYFIGQSLIRLNRPADAEKSFIRELEINPLDPVSKYHLALTLIERKIETERAVRILEDAISLRYNYADALYQLGKIYLEKGENEKAITQLEGAVSADASKDYIHYQLSIAYRKVSRIEDANRELKIYQKLKEEKRRTDQPMPMGANESSPVL